MNKEQIREEALENHKRLSDLFKKNRFMFELEAKKQVEDFINNAPEEYRENLWKLHEQWKNTLKGAGSKHNRLVLASHMFNEQIQRFNDCLKPFREE